MSKIANRLVAPGSWSAYRPRDDERSTLLALTPAGREIGERIMRHAQPNLDATLADWSPEEVQTLRRCSLGWPAARSAIAGSVPLRQGDIAQLP